MLGVSCRGTDFIRLRPKGHPRQPDVKVVIDKVKKLMLENNYDYIYITTEEKQIIEMFYEVFSKEKTLVMEREYYDKVFYANSEIQYVTEVTFQRDNDLHMREWEYLASVVMLSECNALCGGNCGATRLALIMNDLRYEFVHIFNEGLY